MRIRKKIIFLLWYDWVDVPLPSKVKQLCGYRQRIIVLDRETFKRAFCRPENDSKLPPVTERDYRTLDYKGLNLWEICKSSICDHIQTTVPLFPVHAESIAEFYSKGISYIRGFQRLLTAERPDAIVVEQGFQMDMRAAVEAARVQKIRTIAIENSFLKDFFFLDDATGGITNRTTLSRLAWDRVRARSLNEADRNQLKSFGASAITTFQHSERVSRTDLELQLGIPSGKKLALLLGQVATDASIVMDSPLYEDQLEFMNSTVEAMEQYANTHHLVVRLHPKEAFGTSHFGIPFANRTYSRLQEQGIENKPWVSVVHSDQANTYELMDQAQFGLTLNSQAGFEMLLRRKPVLVAGDAFYSHKGFTWDISRRSQLAPTIHELVSTSSLKAEQVRDVERFAYALFFEHLWPKNLDACEERLRSFFA